jgi:uncharacterized protein (TIGR03089 family)
MSTPEPRRPGSVPPAGPPSRLPPTFPAALAAALAAGPSRPLVTFYDDATGERVELSVATYANWVAKTANLAQDELDLGRGGLVLVELPTHWLGAVWLGAAWALGLVVTDDPAMAGSADLVVCGPETLDRHAAGVDQVPVVALSLRPLGGRFTDPLPMGVTDYGAVVLAQPDVFGAYDPPQADDAAWRDDAGSVSQAELLAGAAGSPAVSAGGRLLTDVNPASRRGLATLVAPVLLGAGTVWVRNPDEARWSARAGQERVTEELRG